MKKLLMILGTAAALLTLGAAGLEEGFRSPPRSASPHALYHLMNGNVTKEGITCDFEALSAAGIGGVQVFDVGCYIPPGPVVFGTPEWFGLMRHVQEEGKRLGLEVSLRDSSGWSNSGGPWITPDKAMKVIVAKSAFAKGPSRFHAVLGRGVKDDNGWYEDIRVLAFPTPKPGARLTHLSDKTGRTRTRQPLYRALGNHRPDFLDDPVPPNDRREHPSRDVKEFPPEMAVAKESVIDVTAHMAADGTFDWDVPAGDWTIMRVGAACNGRCNHPAARGGRGLEVDKLSASAVEHHFNAYAARLCDALGIHRGSPKSNAGLTTIHIDSYEVGGQNWTQGLDVVFERRTGRSLVPFLPVFANRIVGSVAETEDFLECFRRVIADLFAENYAGTMARLCHERGLAFSLEPYGNCVADDLQYGQDADTPIAEFWSNAMLGDHGVGGTGNARHAAYLAHVWGRRRAGAEAFTAHPRNGGCWATTPFSIKGQTDRAYAAGVNCIFYHRFAHQPWAGNKYLPGMTMGRWGMHLDRTQTWWHIAPEIFTYQARCQWMLQEGLYAADLLYWCGEAAPNFGLGCRRPPAGYAWDVCATKALEMLKVRNGKVVVPGGVEYELLVLPQGKIGERMRRRIAELEAQGAKVVDPAKETPGAALRRLGIAPDFICTAPDVSWIHRKGNGADWYFVACDNATNATFEVSFRQTGRQPEIWNAETGETTDSVNWREEDGRTVVVLDFPPSGSAFVVFRRVAGKTGESGSSGSSGESGTTGITGPWQVSFPVDWYTGGNAVKSFVWPALKDWTSDADPDVKYFSGTATYRVSCPMSHVPPDTRAILDLGDVKNFAEITVNGRKHPPLWRPPFRVDVTDAIRAGVKDAIDIEVKVTNLWPNRLIGDDRLCSDDCDWSAHRREKTVVEYGIKRIPEWVKQGRRSPTGRHTFTTWKHWTKDDAPLPSGLLGPVVFRFEKAGTRQVERAAPAADFTLEKSGVRATIDGDGRLVRLVNTATGHDWAGGGALWRLYFDKRYTPPGTPFAQTREERDIVVEASCQKAKVERRGESVVISYPSLKCRDRDLAMSLEIAVSQDADGSLRFASKIVNDEPHTIVRELHCPLVGDCSLPRRAELLTTDLGGMRIKNPVKRIGKPGVSPPYMDPDQKFRQFGKLKYPDHTTANCFALMNDDEGLYVASHDPSFQDTIHLLRCWPDAKGAFTRLEAGLAKYPNVMCGQAWSNSCNVVRPYSGDWRETARTYRAWANSWWKKRVPPAWVRKMTGWQRVIFRHQYGEDLFTPADMDGRIFQAGAGAGLDTLLCFGWWRRGMDNGYPDSFFETEPEWGGDDGWRKAIAGWRARGLNFLLYFNGKLIDTESDYFRKGPGRRIAYKTQNGDVYTEQYRFSGTGTFTKRYNARTFATADHREPEWMKFLESAVDRAIDFGASGVFFDQLGYCEPNANWDVSGEFPVPNVRTIAAKAEALAHLRDYIESKGIPDFAIGTECFVDCCAQSVDFMHNLIGATGPENFTEWARYAFPECIVSDREIRDDLNVPWRVNHNLLVGLRSDVEIYRCRGLVDETPTYQRKLAEINRLRAEHPILTTGRFTGPDGLSVDSENGLLAYGYRDGDRLSVVYCTPKDRPASGTISVEGMTPATIRVDLPANGIGVAEFAK